MNGRRIASLVMIANVALLGASLHRTPARSSAARSAGVDDTTRPLALLDYLRRSVKDPGSAGIPSAVVRFDAPDSVAAFVCSGGLTRSDVNEDHTYHFTAAEVRAQLKARKGAAFTSFAHLGWRLNEERSWRQVVSFHDATTGTEFMAARGAYALTFKGHGEAMCLLKLAYLVEEGE